MYYLKWCIDFSHIQGIQGWTWTLTSSAKNSPLPSEDLLMLVMLQCFVAYAHSQRKIKRYVHVTSFHHFTNSYVCMI